MSQGDSKERALARKALARQLRSEAYQRAKAQRAKDPKYLAMKETVKLRRREAYAQIKGRRKAVAVEQKARQKEQHNRKVAEERMATDVELLKMLSWGAKGSDADN
jgi:hypothetical protein